MNLNEFHSSKYLGKDDVPSRGLALTIASFAVVDMRDGDRKPCINWQQAGVKPLLLNKTNIRRLEKMFGTTETKEMVGQQVVVFNDPTVEYGGEQVGGLRLRAPLGKTDAPATAAPQPPAPPAQPAPEVLDDDIPF